MPINLNTDLGKYGHKKRRRFFTLRNIQYVSFIQNLYWYIRNCYMPVPSFGYSCPYLTLVLYSLYNITPLCDVESHVNTQRHNNVVSTLLRRNDVTVTSKRRYYNIMCLDSPSLTIFVITIRKELYDAWECTCVYSKSFNALTLCCLFGTEAYKEYLQTMCNGNFHRPEDMCLGIIHGKMCKPIKA